MTREEKIAKARQLRDEGKTYREIGEFFGGTNSMGYRLINPEKAREQNARRSTYKREHERIHRAKCPRCGGRMGMGSVSPSKRAKLCQSCARQMEEAKRDARNQEIISLWNQGYSLAEIAERLDSTPGSISVSIARLRKAGYSLNYRHRMVGTKRVAGTP